MVQASNGPDISSHAPGPWINSPDVLRPVVEKMVRADKPSAVEEDDRVEIVQDKEPGEQESAAPEWERNPGV